MFISFFAMLNFVIVIEDSSLSQQIGLEFEILDPKNCLVSNVKDEGQLDSRDGCINA